MNENEIKLIQSSFEQIHPDLPRLAKYFYSRLSELDAAMDAVMEGDAGEEGYLFCLFFEHFVASLDRPEQLIPELKLFADKLQEYHLGEDCVQSMGVAFIDTLAFGFKYDFSSDLTKIWTKAYRQVAELLIRELTVKA